MALFDNDFIETIVTEGKDCDKDCKKGKDVEDEKEEKEDEDVKDEEEVEDADEELSDEDKEEAEESARFDVEEASSIEDMKGIAHVVSEMSSDCHFTCLEFMGTTIALDKVDVACTESYNRAVTEAEKEAVTEEFKENVKKYYQKFKAFILKVKNIIVRAYNRAKQYVSNFFAKVSAKLNTMGKIELDGEKLKANKVETYEKLTLGLNNLNGLAVTYLNTTAEKLIRPVTSPDFDAEAVKSAMANNELPTKEAIIKELLGNKVSMTADKFKDAVADLKKPDFKALDAVNKAVRDKISTVEKSVSSDKDLDSAKMAVKVSAVNKLVSYLNRVFAVIISITQRWVSVRVSVVRSCQTDASKYSNQVKNKASNAYNSAKDKASGAYNSVKDKFSSNKESWTLLDSFEAEW